MKTGLAFSIATSLAFLTSPLLADTHTWSGLTGSNWNTALNWSPTLLPADGDSLAFVSAATTNNNFSPVRTFANITISAPTQTINGSAVQWTGTFSATNSAANITINAPLSVPSGLTSPAVLNVSAAGGILTADDVSLASNLIVNGVGTVTIGSDVDLDVNTLIKEGPGTLERHLRK